MGRKATLHLIYHIVLSYHTPAWAGKDASRLSAPSSATFSQGKYFRAFCFFFALNKP